MILGGKVVEGNCLSGASVLLEKKNQRIATIRSEIFVLGPDITPNAFVQGFLKTLRVMDLRARDCGRLLQMSVCIWAYGSGMSVGDPTRNI